MLQCNSVGWDLAAVAVLGMLAMPLCKIMVGMTTQGVLENAADASMDGMRQTWHPKPSDPNPKP